MNTEKTCEFIFPDGQVCNNKVLEGNHYCLKHSENLEYDMQLYTQALETFRQDLREYFIRSNIYLVTDLAIMYAISSRGIPESVPEIIIIVVGVSFGIVITYSWHRVSKGAFFWLQEWRKEVGRLDKELNRFQSYATLEGRGQGIELPSEVANQLPRIFYLFWVIILILNILFYKKLL